jgi:hypothetical protein
MAPWVTEKFLAVLSGLTERYTKNKRSERQEVIEEAVQAITASAKKDGVAIPPNLHKVQSYCYEHIALDAHSPPESACLVSKQLSEETAIYLQDL